MPPSSALVVWARVAGLCLFLPALAIPGIALPLQPLDLVVLAGIPIAARRWAWLSRDISLVVASLFLSLGLCWVLVGGQVLVLAHGIGLVLPFLVLVFLTAGDHRAREAFLSGFLVGGSASIALFLAQIVVGAETLDFRTNTGFSLPPQYGRGFALFPEVSTFAYHTILVLAVCSMLALHPATASRARRHAQVLVVVATTALMLTRSTSFLVVAPVLVTVAITRAYPLRPVMLLRLLAIASALAAMLWVFFTGFYSERLETAAASRSFQMRLASILAGLSPLWSGDVFGVGLGDNHEIARRAHDIAHALDLRFGQLPRGVNSQLVARVFEEGWLAVLNFLFAGIVLLRSLRRWNSDPVIAALVVLSVGSVLGAGLITGYRAIYTNWLWLALPAGVLGHTPVLRRTAPKVRNRMARSSQTEARRV